MTNRTTDAGYATQRRRVTVGFPQARTARYAVCTETFVRSAICVAAAMHRICAGGVVWFFIGFFRILRSCSAFTRQRMALANGEAGEWIVVFMDGNRSKSALVNRRS